MCGKKNPDWLPKDAPRGAIGKHDRRFRQKHGKGKYGFALLPWLRGDFVLCAHARRTRLLNQPG